MPKTARDAFLCRNDDRWQNIAFEGLRFTSGTPGASFFSSYSSGGAANYRFTELAGPFHAEDIRFGLRSPGVVVIDCEWGQRHRSLQRLR